MNPALQNCILRAALPADISAIQCLIFEHGANEWNHLPEHQVKVHFSDIETGKVQGIVAEKNGEIVGIVTYETGIFYPEYEPSSDTFHGYIAEGVVHRQFVGQGIGMIMLKKVLDAFAQDGIRHIYAKRHEENPFSKRLLQKAGFEEVATFYDPEIRPTGSRCTTVCRYRINY